MTVSLAVIDVSQSECKYILITKKCFVTYNNNYNDKNNNNNYNSKNNNNNYNNNNNDDYDDANNNSNNNNNTYNNNNNDNISNNNILKIKNAISEVKMPLCHWSQTV